MKIDNFGPWRRFSSVNHRTDGAEAPILYYPVLIVATVSICGTINLMAE